jgi:pimeloyl-ACP methyl ester carboxylesterase
VAPAAIYGNSSGAIIGLNLVLRHPQVVRGAILHEPPLLSVLAQPGAVTGVIQPLIERGLAAGGPRGAVEAFVRFAAGDSNYAAMDPAWRERVLGNGETFFGLEFGTFEAYRPGDHELARVAVPLQVMAGAASAAFFGEASQWLATRLKVSVAPMPGAHTPQRDHPRAMAEAIRPFLLRVSGAVTR